MWRWVLTGLLCLAVTAHAEPTVIKIGSLAPRESPWGQVLRVWQKAVKEKSGGELQVEIFWNATQGDEPAQISKMRIGQLDGAVVTAVGLGAIDPAVNVLQVPGVYADWAALDRAREALRPRFDKSFREAGFELVGWGDVGLDRFMSRGAPVRSPKDLEGRRPWVWREDLIAPSMYQGAKVTTVTTSLPEALPEFSTGNANVVTVCALAAEQLQWSSRFDSLNTMVVSPNIGGLVLAKARLDSLPAAQRALLLDTGRITAKALTERIRKEDATALERLKKRMTVVEPTADELQAWNTFFQQSRSRLAKGTLPGDLLSEVEKLAKP